MNLERKYARVFGGRYSPSCFCRYGNQRKQHPQKPVDLGGHQGMDPEVYLQEGSKGPASRFHIFRPVCAAVGQSRGYRKARWAGWVLFGQPAGHRLQEHYSTWRKMALRKKSHISLAKYIVDSLAEQELVKHRKAFYLGSILPDCKPSFITVKHEMEGTFPKVQRELEEIVARQQNSEINMRVFYRSLGEVIHYIADYFTFPHNSHYTGNLKDHCVYEEHLKKSLKEYIQSGEAKRNSALISASVQNLDSAEDICNFIQKAHETYVKLKNYVEGDCRHIVTLCHQVVAAVIRLIRRDSAAEALPAAS